MFTQRLFIQPDQSSSMTQRQLQVQRGTGVGNFDLQVVAQHAQQLTAAQTVLQLCAAGLGSVTKQQDAGAIEQGVLLPPYS
ncbi:hypothetical protein ULG90_10710 [Halopseudomonas pachastrellae]|nr:hypothetical protein ULG90_10710 [Halopseudomonas pachastrellae]